MLDEHAIKMLDSAGKQIERQRKWRARLSTKAREIVNRQAREIRDLKAALVAHLRDDE